MNFRKTISWWEQISNNLHKLTQFHNNLPKWEYSNHFNSLIRLSISNTDSHLCNNMVMDSKCHSMDNPNSHGRDSRWLTDSSHNMELTIHLNSQVSTMLCHHSNQGTACLLSNSMVCHPNNQASTECLHKIPTSNNLPNDRKFKTKTIECMSQLVYYVI